MFAVSYTINKVNGVFRPHLHLSGANHMTTTINKQMSLRESAASDFIKGLKGKLTGWAIVSKARTGPNSRTQTRKKNRKS